MPILNVAEAKNIIICNLRMDDAYSGVKNTLGDQENAVPLFGDAAQTVPKLLTDYRKIAADKEPAETTATDAESTSAKIAEAPTLLHKAEKVIIVPGYGMAIAQAQQAVKSLIDTLETDGKEVKVAIHPVAGRMPGHMNVLLAEVGVDYDKLYEMDTINPEFPETDVAVVVGASDVINPAATTAKGTPIYGMPILNVAEAKNIIICNLRMDDAYSGVKNTLGDQENAVPLFGDAAQTVPKLLTDYREKSG